MRKLCKRVASSLLLHRICCWKRYLNSFKDQTKSIFFLKQTKTINSRSRHERFMAVHACAFLFKVIIDCISQVNVAVNILKISFSRVSQACPESKLSLQIALYSNKTRSTSVSGAAKSIPISGFIDWPDNISTGLSEHIVLLIMCVRMRASVCVSFWGHGQLQFPQWCATLEQNWTQFPKYWIVAFCFLSCDGPSTSQRKPKPNPKSKKQ